MRILHFADVHIGVENYSRTDPDTGLSTRLHDFLETFDELVDYAIGANVDLALFCGDAYKSRDPSQTHQREFAKRIVRLSEAGIPSFLLIGNHDTPHVQGRATSLDIYRTLPLPMVTIGDNAATYIIETPAGPIQIVAVPWVRRSQLLARDEMRGLSTIEINAKISDTLTNLIQIQAQRLDPHIPAILAGHVTVNDARTSSEQSMMLGSDHVLLRSSVALPQFDYVALGHIHKHQIIGRNPHVVYSGSLQRIDFGEERDEKGFCVIELDTTKPQGNRISESDFHFQTVNARRFLTIDVKLDAGDPSPNLTVADRVSRHATRDAIVKLNIEMPASLEPLLSDSEIRASLSEAHYVAAISRQITERPRTRLDGTYSDGLTPSQLLERYLDSRDTPPDRAKDLLERGSQLIVGSDSD